MGFADIWGIPFQKTNGVFTTLASYRDARYIVIVNTATLCGLAPQMRDLNALYERYEDRGVVVLGFPCDQFASQEQTNDADMQDVCLRNFGATFPLFARVKVNGDEAHPLFVALKKTASGFFGSRIKWNFTKFVIDTKTQKISRFAPVTPIAKIEQMISRGL